MSGDALSEFSQESRIAHYTFCTLRPSARRGEALHDAVRSARPASTSQANSQLIRGTPVEDED
jgi:hypothetical protein